MKNQVTKPPMILVMEKDALLLTGISAVLHQQGYRCFLARDREVALKATEQQVFDLFLVSFANEVDEACETASSLRQANATKDIPVIFMADLLDDRWREKLHSAGGVYCLPKPFEPDVLLDLVDRTLWMPQLSQLRITPPKAHFAKDWVRLS